MIIKYNFKRVNNHFTSKYTLALLLFLSAVMVIQFNFDLKMLELEATPLSVKVIETFNYNK